MTDSPKNLCDALCRGVTTLDPCSQTACDSDLGKFLSRIEAGLELTADHLSVISARAKERRDVVLREIGSVTSLEANFGAAKGKVSLLLNSDSGQ